MNHKNQSSNRTIQFIRNDELESMVQHLNALLHPAHDELIKSCLPENNSPPVILVFGAPRTGSTLLMQWLAITGLCAYPSNFLSRFYQVPLIGAKIQQLLTDPRYAFRDELFDLQVPKDFESTNGKTSGALSPNEFWYFWRRFGFDENYTFMPNDKFRAAIAESSFSTELQGLAQVFGKPFALKAMIANQNIGVMNEIMKHSIFIWIRRKPEYNIQSLLEARRRQHGSLNQWYSYRIKEFSQLVSLEPHCSVAGQVYHINHTIADSFESLPEGRKLIVDYESFCENPRRYYRSLYALLKEKGMSCIEKYSGPREFKTTNQWRIQDYSREEVLSAYKGFHE